jgi:hypothetical protein
MELAKMTVSSSVGPLLHLFLCLVSKSSSTDQGEALDALLLPLQGQQGSLERSVGLDQTVATCDVMDYDPRAQKCDRMHVCAIRLGSPIAYMCDRMNVRLRTPGGAGVLKCGSLFGPFSAKSHDRATIVMGCMMFHECRITDRGSCTEETEVGGRGRGL